MSALPAVAAPHQLPTMPTQPTQPTAHRLPAPQAARPIPVGRQPGARSPLAPVSAQQAVRRQLAAVVLVAVVLAVLGIGLGRALSPPTFAAAPTPASVVVQPGQSVWEIAVTHAPSGVTTAAYVDAIVETNGLDGGQVSQWQVLTLPTG